MSSNGAPLIDPGRIDWSKMDAHSLKAIQNRIDWSKFDFKGNMSMGVGPIMDEEQFKAHRAARAAQRERDLAPPKK